MLHTVAKWLDECMNIGVDHSKLVFYLPDRIALGGGGEVAHHYLSMWPKVTGE
jgi:hypothetical protein